MGMSAGASLRAAWYFTAALSYSCCVISSSPSALSFTVREPICCTTAAGAEAREPWHPATIRPKSATASTIRIRLELPVVRHRGGTAGELDHVDVLLARLHREAVQAAVQVELEEAGRLARHLLERHEGAADLGVAAVHEAGAHVVAGHDDDPVPLEVAQVLDVAVLDDEDAGALDAAVQREAGEGRRGVGVPAEVDEPGIVAGAEVHGLVHPVGARAEIGRAHV